MQNLTILIESRNIEKRYMQLKLVNIIEEDLLYSNLFTDLKISNYF